MANVVPQTRIHHICVIILLILSACSSEKESMQYFDYKNNPKPLSKAHDFFVISLIVTPSLNVAELESSFIKNLQDLGTVYSDQKLVEEKRGETSSGIAILQFMLGNIAEAGEHATIFPVIEASLSVNEGIEVLRNHAKAVAPIWKANQYFADDEKANESAHVVIKTLVQQFAEEYKKANPNRQPTFDLALTSIPKGGN